jgi:hypothetical protein
LELVPVDDDQASRVAGEIIAVVAVIEMVVEDDGRTVIVAQSAPAVVVISMVPMNPGRAPTPMILGNPVPAEAKPPAPSAVMGCAPAPWLVRNPGPADDRIPDPAAVVIGPPIVVADRRNPDIAVRSFVGPAAVARQLVLVIGVIHGKVGLCQAPGEDRVAAGIPVVEIVAPGIERAGGRDEAAVGSRDLFAVLDQDRALFGRRFGGAAVNSEFGFFALKDIDPEQAFLHQIERGVGGMDLEVFLSVQVVDSDIDAAGNEVQLGQVAVAAGQVHHIDQGVAVQTEIVSLPELDFRSAVPCPELVARDDNKVHFSLFVAKILGPLDIDVAIDITQTGITAAVIALLLAKHEKGKNHNQCRCDHDEFFHLFSPSTSP